MNNIFSEISHGISTKGKDKLDELKKMHMIEEADEYSQDGINGTTPLDDLVNDLIKDWVANKNTWISKRVNIINSGSIFYNTELL